MSDLDDVRHLLDLKNPADALASYYALYHDRKRTRLTLHRDDTGRANGFLVSCRTGQDLFRPTVTLRAPSVDIATELFRRGMTAGLPALVIVPDTLAQAALNTLQMTDLTRNRVYSLHANHFERQINIMVQAERGPNGLPVFVIRAAGGQTVARAGLAWKSPDFAEVTVYADPAAVEREYDRSVLVALAGSLLDSHVRPISILSEHDSRAIRLAESVGFADTGARILSGQGVLQVG